MPIVDSTDAPKSAVSYSIFHPSITAKMWVESSILAIGLFTLFLIYVFIQTGSLSLSSISIAIAATAAIMIGLSFAMSGFCFYYNFLDTKIAYRKYLGLVGYWLALTYCFMLLLVDPYRYYYGFFDNLLSIDFVLGLTAMTILSFTAFISNSWAMQRLGVTRWRYGLRLGYLAYFLLIIRAIVLEHQLWLNWLQLQNSLPPIRLLLSIFASCVLLLRLSMIMKAQFTSPILPISEAK